ncbi:MAG: hypothetical protein P8Z30_06065 [Acidobacteriota bacterium]
MTQRTRFLTFLILILLIPVAYATALAAGPVTVTRSGDTIHLANDFLARTLEVQEGTVQTTQLLNKLSGRSYRAWGDEFRLKLIYPRVGYEFGSENPAVLTSRNFRVTGQSVVNLRWSISRTAASSLCSISSPGRARCRRSISASI